MNDLIRERSIELTNTLTDLTQAKTVEQIANLINKSIDQNEALYDLLEDELTSSEDKEVIIQSLREELESTKKDHLKEIEELKKSHEQTVDKLNLDLEEKDKIIENMQIVENYHLGDNIAEVTLHEILDSLKRIEHMSVEINGKVENTEVVVRNMNLNSNSSHKTLNKLTANVGNLVELVKIYVKNVSNVEKRVEDSNTVAKDALNKAEEAEAVVMDVSEEIKDLKEDMHDLQDNVKEVEQTTKNCVEEVKEVKGVFQKLKGLFR